MRTKTPLKRKSTSEKVALVCVRVEPTAGGASGYAITADPIEPNKSGRRHFYTDQTGVIRASSGDEQATVDSEPLD